jgi:hypothetical protein
MKSGQMVLVLAMLLAGCGGAGSSGSGNAQAPGAAGTPDPIEAKIRALTPVQRRIALFRAIYDADFTCKQIVSIVDQPRDGGHPVWLVTCDDQGEYIITLQPGGTFTVSGVPQPKGGFRRATPTAAPIK